MQVRRIVVGNVDGVSRVIEDGTPPRSHVAKATPGFAQSLVWATPPQPSLEHTGDPTLATTTLLPAPGGTTLAVLTLPPDSVYADPSFDPVAAGAELLASSPGIADRFEPDVPGMHTTPTVDYDVVVDGEVWLELTDGEVHLGPGDIVVQQGTRHAWRNRSDRPVRILTVLIGAE